MLKPCFCPERVCARCLACAVFEARFDGAALPRPSRLPVCVESDFLPDPVWLFLTAFATTMLRFGWQGWRDSNPRPPVLETGALPIELQP